MILTNNKIALSIICLSLSLAQTAMAISTCYVPNVDEDKYIEVGCLDKGQQSDSLAPVSILQDGLELYGFVDKDGNEIIQPQFASVMFGFQLNSNLSAVRTLSGGAGFINRKGEFVVPSIYDYVDSFRQGRARVAQRQNDNIKYGFIDQQGNLITDIIYDFVLPFEHDHAIVSYQTNHDTKYELTDPTNLWTVINLNGDEILPARNDVLPRFLGYDGLSFVTAYDSNKFGFMTYAGNTIAKPIYDIVDNREDGLIRLIEDIQASSIKTKMINSEGDRIFDEEYQKIEPANSKKILLTQHNQSGYADMQGKLIIPLDYDVANPFNEKAAVVAKDGLYGTISPSGETIIALQYEYLKEFSDTLYLARDQQQNYALLDRQGKPVTDFTYQHIHGDADFIYYQRQNKWGVMNEQGQEVTSPLYDDVIGVPSVTDNILTVVKNGKIGFIDHKGQIIVPINYDKPNFPLEYASVEPTQRQYDDKTMFHKYYQFYYGFASVYRDGKWGVVNKQGKLVVPCLYDSIKNDGMAYFLATKDNITYKINRVGRVVTTVNP